MTRRQRRASAPGVGSVALVTGASSGIGAVTAGRLASAGYRVYGTSRHPRADDEGVRMVTMDVRDEESVRSAVADITDEAGRIDLLINNAGVLHVGMAEETSREQMIDVFETNFFGTVRVTDSVLPQMRERRHGRVINVGSLAAWFGEPGEGFYAASKAALAATPRRSGTRLGISASTSAWSSPGSSTRTCSRRHPAGRRRRTPPRSRITTVRARRHTAPCTPPSNAEPPHNTSLPLSLGWPATRALRHATAPAEKPAGYRR